MLTKSKVKYIQSLGQKKFREQHRVFTAEGPKLLRELLYETNCQIEEIFALQKWAAEHEAKTGNTAVTIVSPTELEKISQLTTPNEVVAVVKQFHNNTPAESKHRITVALDDIRDPGNLGTIIRIADWFGIDQLVCSPTCADCYNPKVVQATMGSIARVKVYYTDLLNWLKTTKHSTVYAAVLEGQEISSLQKITEGVLLIGNESKGISPALVEAAGKKITIARKGKAESLNAAVATGIILSHLV